MSTLEPLGKGVYHVNFEQISLSVVDFEHILHLFFSFSIVDFELVIVTWIVPDLQITFILL